MTVLVLSLALLLQDDENGFLGLHEADMSVQLGDFNLLLSGTLDLEHYVIDEEAPGLLFFEDDGYTSNPRLTFFVDATYGERLYLFMQARGDRGFDPDYHDGGEGRIDELFVRFTAPEGENRTWACQVGKFATPLGNFVPRHDSMHNPLVRAPLVYDHITTISDGAAPSGNAALIARRDIPDLKDKWVTMIWGPVYHTGILLFKTGATWDSRLALTNAAPSERPGEWDHQRFDDDTLAWSYRMGWNPFIGFKIGINGAYGPYLRGRAEKTLRPGRDQEDYPQKLLGIDLEYSIGHLVMFAELYRSEWEVPNVAGDPSAVSYYVEAKYSLFPGFFVAGRWGQIFFNDIESGSGSRTPWDRNAWRAELGAGYFIYVNLLAKAQIEINHTHGRDPDDNAASLSLSLSF